ncbi:MAG: D-glycero-beta-D-manno-heptose-7-phosphate kinase [Bryobacteraceae bacterium]
MSDLRSCFARTTILVVGDLMLDEYVFGGVSRISPEAPVPVLDVKNRRYVPGGAANVAANLRSLGAHVRLAGAVGEDAAGGTLRSALLEAGIGDELLVPVRGRVTTAKTRVVAGQQQIVRFDSEERAPLHSASIEILKANVSAAAPVCTVCVLSDYGKGLLSAPVCNWLIECARAHKLKVIVDPKGLDFSKYRGCTLITPNLNEAAQASGVPIESERDLFEAGDQLLSLLPGTSVLVTRGSEGMTLFRQGKPPLAVAAAAREVFDVVGAGDTAAAALSVSVAAGLTLETATRLANIAAGIAVGRHGTVTVSIDDLLAHTDVKQLMDAEA